MTFHRLLALGTVLLPALALAQAAPTRDKEAVSFNEIERGFFVGVNGGYQFMLEAPGGGPFSPGQQVAVEVGLEIGERVAIAVFALGQTNRAGAEYLGKSQGTASGDFFTLVPGASARFNLVGFNDVQGAKRTWLYLRGGAGLAMFSPKTLLPDSDIFGFAGAGVEYFTRLRHFSVGLEVTGTTLVSSGTFGLAVTPNLRYAF
jgi:hypothetical protein